MGCSLSQDWMTSWCIQVWAYICLGEWMSNGTDTKRAARVVCAQVILSEGWAQSWRRWIARVRVDPCAGCTGRDISVL
eukprot:5693349-Amphidinium_carterae.1